MHTGNPSTPVARMSTANPGSAMTDTPGPDDAPRVRAGRLVTPRDAHERNP